MSLNSPRRLSTAQGDVYIQEDGSVRSQQRSQDQYRRGFSTATIGEETVPPTLNNRRPSLQEFANQPRRASVTTTLILGKNPNPIPSRPEPSFRPEPTRVPIHPTTGRSINEQPIDRRRSSINNALLYNPQPGRKMSISSQPRPDIIDRPCVLGNNNNAQSRPAQNSSARPSAPKPPRGAPQQRAPSASRQVPMGGQVQPQYPNPNDESRRKEPFSYTGGQPLNVNQTVERFNHDALVLGEVGGCSLSDISGVKTMGCPRRGSVIYAPVPEKQVKPQPTGRRSSIYAQLDEMNDDGTLYRTFTAPKPHGHRNSISFDSRPQLHGQDSVELSPITLVEQFP